MKRTLYISSAAAAAVLLVAGPVAAAAASTAEAATGSLSAPLRAADDAEGAAAAALERHPGVIESLGSRDENGSVWHVNVIGEDGSNKELLVTGATVTVRHSNQDSDDRDEDAALVAAKVTAQEAMKAAVAAHPGQVRSVQWDDDGDNNTTYWDVEVKSGDSTTNVHVDPTSGKATVSHSDNDNDNDENDSNDNG
ncbi:PepSY domain-containing protein [Streptomyces sp. NBC_01264]|uniref:PepSY domain-containing protein n=1 Tax=Streptomyces sp. NBC_01264 TaxID=2903804 RepID=UPI002255DC30|nr:PepSY domain-containing protein [Streptomyces sp. NBC_01264]MCX4781103.1 PepSY domain-containing protein [Streptomyces sp. NBC_01264]